jgi:hypothetical protein
MLADQTSKLSNRNSGPDITAGGYNNLDKIATSSVSNSEKNLNLNLVKHSGKSSSANNCSGSIANSNQTANYCATVQGGNTNNLNTPSTSHTSHSGEYAQQHMLSESNENSIRNSPIYNGSKSVGHQQLQHQHSVGRSAAAKNPSLISSCQGSFHSLQGENIQYGSGGPHQLQHQQHRPQHRPGKERKLQLHKSRLIFRV